MSSSEGKPPAVTSEANVKVQYVSLLFVGGGMIDQTSSMMMYNNTGTVGSDTASRSEKR
jgi:hypothetical protein